MNALASMPDGFMIKAFLLKNRAEVEGMLDREYDEEAVWKMFQNDVDAANKRADEAESRADKAESRADKAESRADEAEARLKEVLAELAELKKAAN